MRIIIDVTTSGIAFRPRRLLYYYYFLRITITLRNNVTTVSTIVMVTILQDERMPIGGFCEER